MRPTHASLASLIVILVVLTAACRTTTSQPPSNPEPPAVEEPGDTQAVEEEPGDTQATEPAQPSKEDRCKQAIGNIRTIYGMEDDASAVPTAAIRSCVDTASDDQLQCFIDASTTDDLQQCEQL